MTRCASCSHEISDESLFCGRCGAEVDPSEAPTRTSAGPPADAPQPRPSGMKPGAGPSAGPSSSGSLHPSVTDQERFLPGTVIAERYRIVGLLGRGGMGEVYRADDLTLGQPVALKFLPVEFERDPERLERFLGEVRAARQITHANVCRVHDIGQVGGQHFLSMEYVDGEDLSGLLRRIGRLPSDKATDIACQLAAGLAAAHDQGFLHRDLKPANIMLDGRGRVRITDFGLAGLAGSFEGTEARVGTPAYMAPEQLAGWEVTTRSDVYALGLVLYEIYTGKKPFEASSLLELARMQQEKTPAKISSQVEGLDPVVESLILSCLDRDPAKRPASAMEVVAVLPGGDPLAAALAAGETPSPEMVADAGHDGGLSPPVAFGLLAAALLSIVLTATAVQKLYVHTQVPFELAPQELGSAGIRILENLGYDDLPQFRDSGFRYDLDLLESIEELDASVDRWQRLGTGNPPAVLFWLRFGHEALWPTEIHGDFVRRDRPPRIDRDSLMIELDTQGRLVALEAIPGEARTPSRAAVPDWSRLLSPAGIEGELMPAEIEKSPLVPTTELIAWEVETPGGLTADRTLIQAGTLDGIPNYFEILYPWDRARVAAGERRERSLPDLFFSVFLLALFLVGILVAARNLRRGSGDRRGALRMAAILGAAVFLATLLRVLRFDNLGMKMLIEMTIGQVMAHALLHAVLTWATYIAIEPYVRRLWPQVLVSWSRLMVGRLRDPLVGRDILIGCACLLPQTLMTSLMPPYARAIGWAMGMPFVDTLDGPPNLGVRESLAMVFSEITSAFGITLAILGVILILRLVFRRSWVAIGILGAMVSALFLGTVLTGGEPLAVVAFIAVLSVLLIGVPIFLLLRFGLIAAASLVIVRSLILSTALTLDPTSWYAPGAYVILATVLILVLYAFWVSLAGRPVFGEMLD